MIWTGDDRRSSHLYSDGPERHQVSKVCEDAAVDPVYADEVSKAIAAFVSEHPEKGADLARLTAHVLHQIGDVDAGRAVLVAQSGITRVDSWMVAGDQPVIVVDVMELVAGKGATLETGLFNSLNSILKALWRVGQQFPEGFRVGLRGLSGAATVILGSEAPVRAVQSLIQEIKVHCETWLDRPEGVSPVVFIIDID